MSDASRTASGEEAAGRLLVVHFDVNKTVLATDVAGGLSLEDALLQVCLDRAWGVVSRRGAASEAESSAAGETGDEEAPVEEESEFDGDAERPIRVHSDSWQWEPVRGAPLSTRPPAGYEGRARVVPFTTFLSDVLLPYVDEATCESRGWAPATVRQWNKRVKDERRLLVRRYADWVPAEVAAAVGREFEALRARLTLSPEETAACVRAGVPGASSGLRHLVPAYFHFLRTIQARGVPFGVVFRTFGTDLPEILAEHNLFCEGRHPLYPLPSPFDGSVEGVPDLRIHAPVGTGKFLRHASSSAGTHLATTSGDDPREPGLATFVSGYRAIHALLVRRLRRGHRVLALQDHYEFWKANDETAHAGKMLLLDEHARDEFQIFFDDNVGVRDLGIIDARCAHSGRELDYADVIDRFVVRANIADAILHDSYFIDNVDACVARGGL